jgi:hypothetical protein
VAVTHVTNLRHDCEAHGCYRAELWDWTPFNDCFGDSGIRISDIDGMVERNGLFLMLDGKRDGTFLKQGQLRLYKSFAATKAGTAIVFWGNPAVHPQIVTRARIWRPGEQDVELVDPLDLAGLKQLVADWYEWATGMPRRLPQRTPGITVPALREAELHAADPPPVDEGDWPEVRYPPDHPKYRPVA